MKKFTKILEEVENERFYKITAQVELVIPSENEGEAGYLADSILASIEYGSEYVIDNIEQTEKLEESIIFESKSKIKTELKDKFRNSVKEINRLSESVEQRQTAKDIVKNFPQINFVGKTNKGNLVFENKDKQLKVSPNGQIL